MWILIRHINDSYRLCAWHNAGLKNNFLSDNTCEEHIELMCWCAWRRCIDCINFPEQWIGTVGNISLVGLHTFHLVHFANSKHFHTVGEVDGRWFGFLLAFVELLEALLISLLAFTHVVGNPAHAHKTNSIAILFQLVEKKDRKSVV